MFGCCIIVDNVASTWCKIYRMFNYMWKESAKHVITKDEAKNMKYKSSIFLHCQLAAAWQQNVYHYLNVYFVEGICGITFSRSICSIYLMFKFVFEVVSILWMFPYTITYCYVGQIVLRTKVITSKWNGLTRYCSVGKHQFVCFSISDI